MNGHSKQPEAPYDGSYRGKSKTLTIRTPEGIAFSLAIASPTTRFFALVIDLACSYIATTVIGLAVQVTGLINPDLAGALWLLASFVVSTGYAIILEWFWRGQTFGKMVMHIRVVDEQGLRLRFSQVVIRNLLRVVDMLPGMYLVGGLSSFISSRGQRIGDITANTIVIQHLAISEPDLDQISPGKFNSFRNYPHLASRLRQNVSPTEAGIALQALLRRNALNDDARLQLFAAIRAHLEEIVRFPPESTEGLSNEQYIRNTVDILFR